MAEQQNEGHGQGDVPSGFEIDGERYEVPDFASLTLDEAEIMYDISEVVQEQFAPLHPESSDEDKAFHATQGMRLIAQPKFKRALAHIAYRRRHPDADFDAISLVVGKANALDVSIAFLRGDDDNPPAESSPKQPEDKRSSSETLSSERTGTSSGSDSKGQVVQLSPTGTGG